MHKNESTNLPEKSEIKKAVNEYCREKGIRSYELALKSGIDSSILCDLENEHWNKISNSAYLKIWNFVTFNKVDNFYPTADFVATFKLCDKARKYHFMVGLTADTGMGKTTAVTSYARQKNVFYICYDKTMNPRQFFVCLLRELAYPFDGNMNEMINRASEELNRLDNPLLIIDEAGKLNHTMILYLHVLRDKTRFNCGIVLAGMPYFKTNMQHYADREKEGYAEFLRRINIWQSFGGLSAREVEEICKINGITDPDKIKELKRKRRFGDLMNEIYLYQIMKGDL